MFLTTCEGGWLRCSDPPPSGAVAVPNRAAVAGSLYVLLRTGVVRRDIPAETVGCGLLRLINFAARTAQGAHEAAGAVMCVG